jgi:hypothetical protein
MGMSSRKGKIFLLASILIIVCISLLVFLSGCGSVNEPSGYDTQAIEELQEEIPFTIVVPTYFPDSVELYLANIGGPSIEANPYKSIAFTLTYREKGNNNFIFIREENLEVIFVPSEPSSTYLDFEGTQVLEEETSTWAQPDDSDDSPSDTQLIQGFSYSWCQDGVNFQVDIFGYERNECQKIVESMIEQIE